MLAHMCVMIKRGYQNEIAFVGKLLCGVTSWELRIWEPGAAQEKQVNGIAWGGVGEDALHVYVWAERMS